MEALPVTQQKVPLAELPDVELFERIGHLVKGLQETVTRRGWTQPSVQRRLQELRSALDEVEARMQVAHRAQRERLCQRRFGRLSDDELADRIACFEQELMSAMEVSGPTHLAVSVLSEHWRCACLVASRRPQLWQRLIAEGHCAGAVPEFATPPASSKGSS